MEHDDALVREVTNTLIVELAPVRDVLNRMMTQIEILIARVDALELERLHQRE